MSLSLADGKDERDLSENSLANGSNSFAGSEESAGAEAVGYLETVHTPPLSATQRRKIDALSKLVQTTPGLELTSTERSWMDEACLSRFLRARRYNVQKAYRQLHETIQWRRKFGVERLMLDPELKDVKHQSETGKLYVHGVDIYGRPAVIMKPRYQNTSERKTANEQIRHLVYTLERAITLMEPPVEKLCLIIDFPGYSLRNAPSIKVQRQTLKILQDYYPERLGIAVCIDSPTIFWTFFEIIKPFIDPRTAAKIHFCSRKGKVGTNQHMQTFMRQLFHPDQLELELGGRSTWRYSNEEYFRELIVPNYLSANRECALIVAFSHDETEDEADQVFHDALSHCDNVKES
ncbi:hypothetical protein F1559_004568 [Cyanidiococcus yangmingshanensis]|uniref:CRAL-TRIO domain-containing protein n=1 Tax=Cyanidiococcus yangmingshanensis TaxID=2690220 RepID=A0A7J7IKR9_9RHOD|nr:hypothetical protein F1559_004568 [Cyanidiococcus yangmingshanensis]